MHITCNIFLSASANFLEHQQRRKTGWAVGYNTIQKTTNGGLNWFVQVSGASVISVKFTDSNTGWAVGLSGGILKTTNGGLNWLVQTSGTVSHLRSVHFTNNNNGWAVGSSGTILKTTNGGSNWFNQTSGTVYDLSSVYFVDINTGWSVGYGRILKTVNGGITGIQVLTLEIPDKFLLCQNFPNPFNPTTKINYHLRTTVSVILQVYDMLGKEVRTLVNEKQSPGTYQINFDGANLPDGVYFYRLTTGDFTSTKKMLLLK